MCKQKPIEIYATTEGLYLMKKQINYTGYVLKNSQLTPNKNLLDSNTDYNKIKQHKVYQEMNLRNCFALVNSLENARGLL